MEKKKVTQEYLNSIKKKLEELETVERQKNINDIQEARAQGDLSENADYHAARDRQVEIEAKIAEYRQILENHELINAKYYTIHFIDRNMTETFEIVGTVESNPREKRISNESPIGKAIEGKGIGDRVTVHANGRDFDIIIEDIKESK
ncbi:MAG: transcription elongation factor GreA [Bacilli bacterium]|nr:transcription elongation factor GreA [Bacilli bacterium]MBP5551050.1 transcription elongation factor GreA [Bacilli bacterium]